jgi:hypothetical protein
MQLSKLSEERMGKIKEILWGHKGKENAVPASEISDLIGVDERETYSETRRLVLKAVKKYELPIAATDKGYYFIETQEELINYLGILDSRILEIEERKKVIYNNFVKYHGEIELGEAEEF